MSRRSYDPYTFAEDTLYYWQVVAERPNGERSASPVLALPHRSFPNPPELGSMVYIPAGEFQMGCDPLNSGVECFGEQLPLHTVYLDAFWMDKHEITNAEYLQCTYAGAVPAAKGSVEGRDYLGIE